jgi:hypothetical protein
MPGRQFTDERRDDVVQIGFHDIDQGLLVGSQPAVFQSINIGGDQFLDIGQHVFAGFLFVFFPLF